MASEDPFEKSLFVRIKDCVLTELRRSKNDVKKSSCPSRSTWAWEIDNNGGRKKKPNSDRQGQGQSGGTSVTDNEAKKTEQSDKDSSGEEKPEGAHMEKISEQENISLGNENDAGTIHQRDIEIEGKKHENNNEAHMEKNIDVRENIRSSEIDKKDATRSSPEKNESIDRQRDTCDSNGCKPVRYYIKMQNPEAPVCCQRLKPRKLCPPKVRKGQQEVPDSWSRPTCRCGGCSYNA